MAKDKHTNRLIYEKSPYLLQHANNPIDWMPWGDAAFARAAEENKPVFLSIGYSSCHWCHVMERESFTDEEVAQLLNRYFVAVKVDREERPDVDHVYMDLCQTMSGQGGWPLTMVLTPDKEPIYAATYLPKRTAWGRPGLIEVLSTLSEEWKDENNTFADYGKGIIDQLKLRRESGDVECQLSLQLLHETVRQLERDFDRSYGGFGKMPKFPMTQYIFFLLRYGTRTKNEQALAMAEKTLTMMARGGIRDHLGQGFSRYATDAKWQIPHFEKMLYDNALLCMAYTEGYQVFQRQDLVEVAEGIADYVLRDMRGPDGGFCAAEDADSEGEEGSYYLWTRAEIMKVLGSEAGEIFCDFYQVVEGGNWTNGQNILHHTEWDEESFAMRRKVNRHIVARTLKESRRLLWEVRTQRIPPKRDDKILTGWNGLMIAALAKLARVVDRNDYLTAARQGLDFIETHLQREDGRLLARYRDGEAAYLANLDDYAFVLWACLELYETTLDPVFLAKGKGWAEELHRLFSDEENGGFFFTPFDGEVLVIRPKVVADGAMPAGNSVALWQGIRLAHLLNDFQAVEKSANHVRQLWEYGAAYPKGYAGLWLAADLLLYPARQVTVVGTMQDEETWQMLSALGIWFVPDVAVRLLSPDREPVLREMIPDLPHMPSIQGGVTAYVCHGMTCLPAVKTMERIRNILIDNKY